MFGKSKSTRLNETVAFVHSNASLDKAQRELAAAYLADYTTKNPAPAATLSEKLHIGENTSDPQNFRNSRRAYVMLYTLLAPTASDSLKGLTNGASIAISGITAKAGLPALVKLAAIAQEQATMKNTMSNAALNELLTQKLTFMQNNIVHVSGSPKGPAANSDTNVLDFYFRYELTKGRFQFTPQPLPGTALIRVDSVVARYWNDIPGSHQANAPTTNGDFSGMEGIRLQSGLMLTTQFTGCAFAMKRHNGGVYCSHTTPKPPAAVTGLRTYDGPGLARDIAQMNGVAGDFSNAPGGGPIAVYGRGWSQGMIGNANYITGADFMTLLGFPLGGGDYEFVSQVVLNGAISSARRVF